ncbi:ABC transporter substrate-binding protein [Falsigemmobacter intermedius]|uniref:ABC transporter substrate-binding protein n=1 Tax=Falsigemmobacter intermedius TaxID=1553448 RepID=A0A444MBR7_9RHOB|nr:ABC transporter substrate-binding protein [Falsigemmobacter intermedius]RWY41437.1 ABC transporter substrate-binding protein [Falsigemmobacter intermedius]
MTETRFRTFLAGIALGTSLAFAAPASAEVSEVTLANQFSLSHLPLMIMKDQQFIEKQLAAQGLPDTKVNWISLAGSSAMIDGLLSGSLHVASTGTSGFAVLWDKTKGQVKSLGAQAYNVLNLVTRLPGVEKLEDLPLDTKIAVPAVGTSPQALALKIAALQKFGPDQINRFDQMTVTMAHPDAYAALQSSGSGVDSHFTAPPFEVWETARIDGAKVILSAEDVQGGEPATGTVLMATTKFRDANPKTFTAVHEALKDSVNFINENPEEAAKIYLAALNNTKDSVEETAKLIADPRMGYTVTPTNVVKLLGLFKDVGAIKTVPEDWKDLFFPELHELNGN